ncbi:MAG: hypothetical protein LBQ66_10120 [Planctomycetaceae bacterium]|jgi:hypothetical protein|nr:hypothetical protein [Planctomycetaceae bacterium]
MRLITITLGFAIFLAILPMFTVVGLAQNPMNNNQINANRIADSLGSRFPGYDIIISYRNGRVELHGMVASEAMIRDVGEYVRNIDGVVVNNVDNRLQTGERGTTFIPPNPNTPSLPPAPRREPPAGLGALATLSAPSPDNAAPAPPTASRYTPSESNAVTAPARIPAPLLAMNVREPNYSDVLPPSLTSPTTDNDIENTDAARFTGTRSNVADAYYAESDSATINRSPVRPAVAAPLPLYADPSAARTAVPNYAPANSYAANPYGYAAPNYSQPPYYGGTPNGMPSAYNRPNLPNYAWPSYAAYPNYAAVSYPRSYSVQAWPYIGPFYPYPQAPLGWRQVTLKYDHARWWLDFNDGEPSGPLSPLFRQPGNYRY